VRNVPPLVDAGPDATVVSGQAFRLHGRFSDPGTLDAPWHYEIDWDRGVTTRGTTDDASQPIVATSPVPYCAAGPYTLSLTVRDRDGDTGTDAMRLTALRFPVAIAIQPGGDALAINLRRQGLLPVTVLSTATFDATRVDPATVTLGDEIGTDTPVAVRPNGRFHTSVEDVDGDGRDDLVLMFAIPDLVRNGDLTEATTALVLRGRLTDGCTEVRGESPIRVVR
jgi:hypothetical protein